MKKTGKNESENEFGSDDEMYASYDAYKALIEAGASKAEALKRTGLTLQILKDLEEEEGDDDIKSEFKEVWFNEEEEEGEDSAWKEGPVEEDSEWGDDADDLADDFESESWDDKY
jgi:hypothetical protein